MIPLLAIKSFTALNSESNLTVKAFETGVCPGLVLGVVAEIGVGPSLLEQAAAKQETQTAAKPPETVCKNFALFMEFYFSNILNQNLFKKI
jgi:ABC-type phosphonate transport system ATPase subunit